MNLLRFILKKENFILMLLLLLFWMILTPNISMEGFIVAVIACWGVAIYCRGSIFSKNETSMYTLKGIWTFIRFVGRLLIEIIKANIDVAKIVLSPSMPISPTFVRVRNPLKKDMNKVIYANAITLTPGTLTVDLTEDELIIHALTRSAGEGIENSQLEKAALQLEEGLI